MGVHSLRMGWVFMLIAGLYAIVMSIIAVATGFMDVLTGMLLAIIAIAIVGISLGSYRRADRWSWWCLLVLGSIPLLGITIYYIDAAVTKEVGALLVGWVLFVLGVVLPANTILGSMKKPLTLFGVFGLLLGTALLAYLVLVPQKTEWHRMRYMRQELLHLRAELDLRKREVAGFRWWLPPRVIPSDIVEDEFKKLAPGHILFNPSKEMTLGVRERVEVRIARTIGADLTAGLRGRGEPQIEEIEVGTFMKVRLTGDNFDVKAFSHEEQVVTGNGFTQWDYEVTPLKSGVQMLLLTVTVRIKIPDYPEERKDCPVFERKIRVRPNLLYSITRFIESHWQWLVTTIIGSGIIGWIVAVKRRNSRKK